MPSVAAPEPAPPGDVLTSSCPRAKPAVRHASSTATTASTPRPPIPEEVIRRRAPLPPVEEADSPSSSEPTTAGVLSDETRTFEPPAVSLTQQQLSLLYAYTNPPPESALAAFAARVSLPDLDLLAGDSSEGQLARIEQALIHESFWDGVRNLQDQVALASEADHRKFTNFHDRPLSSSSTSTASSTTPAATDRPTYAHNGALAALGNSLLGTFATELVLESFPHLPTRAAKAALTLYVGPKSLAQVAQLVWGVGPSRSEKALVGREDEDAKVSRKERAYGHLVQGRGGARVAGNEVGAKEGAAGPGLIRWNRKVRRFVLSRVHWSRKLTENLFPAQATSPTKDAVLYEDALASVARALVGVVHETHGFAAARQFCRAHFLGRLVPPTTSTSLPNSAASSDILPLLKFSNPSRVLSLSLTQHGLPPLRHSLLKESGRLTAHPTFVTGAFSGEVKLGEGFGSSIRMSEWRASEDALRRVYLGGGRLDGGFPTDAWARQGAEFKGWKPSSGWTEVEHESR
jgi:large subunit ribosomal protein L44